MKRMYAVICADVVESTSLDIDSLINMRQVFNDTLADIRGHLRVDFWARLIKGDYIEAINYVPLFLVVAVVSGFSAFIGNIFYAIKSTKVISISTLVSGVVTVSASVPFIKLLGANGANIAVLVGFAVNIAIRFLLLKRKIKFKMPLVELMFCGVWITATTLVYTHANNIISCVLFIANGVIALIVFKKDIKSFLNKFLKKVK